MGNSSVEPEKHSRKFYYSFASFAILIVVFVVALFAFQNPILDPLLYNNAITVQALIDKTLYMKGEDVSITACVINGKNERVNCTTLISYQVFDSLGQEVYSCDTLINLPIPLPTYPAHSKYSYNPNVWNQKDANYTLVESGNYTIKVSLEYGTSECKIQIAD
jgi:hypothetical protein